MIDPRHAILIYAAFAVAATVELYFFMMQRSALELGRSAGIDSRQGRLMLPLWYLLFWPARFAKWAAIVQIGLWHGWISALGLLVVTFVFSIIVPIPHSQYVPLFRRKLAKELRTGVQSEEYARLYGLLFEASKSSRFD